MDLLAWLGGRQGSGGGRRGAPSTPEPVTLHVYDLGPAIQGVNMICRAVGTGAFHAGVEVYGDEWSFGCGAIGKYQTGVFRCPPRGCEAHVYREFVEMGMTTMSRQEVRDLISELQKQWPGKDYDLLRHNCCHFSNELCEKLGVGPVPTWVTSLAGVGAMLRSVGRLTVENAAAAPALAVQGVVAAPGYLVNGAVGAVGALAGVLANPFAGDPNEDHADDESPAMLGSHMGPGHFRPPARHGETMLGAGGVGSSAKGGRAWRGGGETIQVGHLVEIFSNSHKAWCPGQVDALEQDDMVTISFKIVGVADATKARGSKKLPIGHKDVRPMQLDPSTPPKLLSKSQTTPLAGPGGLAQGDAVEVYSNSQKAWCAGYVERVDRGLLSLAFRLPGAGAHEWSLKQLPVTSDLVRRRAGEPKVAMEGDSTPAKNRAEQELKAARESGDVTRIQDACTRAEVVGVDPLLVHEAFLDAVRLDAAKELDTAVRSNSRSHIERACKNAADAGVAAAAVDVARAKAAQLPLDHPLQEVEGAKGAADGQGHYSVGDWVEVYSNSNRIWCVGRVTLAKASTVTIAFQLPGARADDWVEKKLPIDSLDVRPPAAPQAQLSQEEEALYRRLYREFADGDPAAAEIDAMQVSSRLWNSGLPRKTLKQVWRIANPRASTRLGFPELAACLRLVAHCQAALSGTASRGHAGLLSAGETLSEGGEPLRLWLEERAKEPPLQMPRFPGAEDT